MHLITERLKLIPLSGKDIEDSLKSITEVYDKKGLKSNKKHLSNIMYKVYNIKLINIKNDPENYLFYTYWLIVKRNTNEIIGRIGYKDIPNKDGEIEVGYGISADYRSKGYMTEALKAFIKWGFKQNILSVKTIIAKTKQENLPSQRVLKKAGFSFEYLTEDLMCWKIDKSNF